jgi:hypothetical protein
MKKGVSALAVTLVVVILLSTPLVAGGKGQFILGGGFQHHRSKWQTEDGECDAGDMSRNMIAAAVAHPLAKGVWGYAVVGVSDLSVEYEDATEDFDGEFEPYLSIGFSGAMKSHLPVAIGPIFEYTRYSDHGADVSGGCAEAEYKDSYEVYLGIEIHHKTPWGSLYGGPLAHWAKTRIEYDKCTTFAAVPPVNLEETQTIGGFVGFNYPLDKRMVLRVIGQYMSDYSFSVSVLRVFAF